VYDATSGEAALIDPGGPVDRLLSVLDAKNLTLKYILITHAHPDHTAGVPAVRQSFPLAKLCMSHEESEDAAMYRQWEEKIAPQEVAVIKKDPVVVELMNFDPHRLGAVDIVVGEDTTLSLGETPISAYLAPGHSRGSICYLVGPVLFSGDVLLYRNVGRTDLAGAGGFDVLVKSVRRLYSTLPDEAEVYPGHGLPTTIGSEKRLNARISDSTPKVAP
jgi:glyoxylase-like metal-dependent hydrolase (beta-lactamase superfamily II)